MAGSCGVSGVSRAIRDGDAKKTAPSRGYQRDASSAGHDSSTRKLSHSKLAR